MKKILLFCFAITALLFTSCDKSKEADGIKFTVTPSTISLSQDETFTVNIIGGEEDTMWFVCWEGAEASNEGKGMCLQPMTGNSLEHSTGSFDGTTGKCKIHVYSMGESGIDIDLGKVSITVEE